MEPNNTDVTTDLSYVEETENLLDYAEHLEREIEIHRGDSPRTSNAMIADAHNALGVTLKRADILSNLAIADAIARLSDLIEVERHGVRTAVSHSSGIYAAARAAVRQ